VPLTNLPGWTFEDIFADPYPQEEEMSMRLKPLEDILEKEWDATLFNSQKGLAPMLGWSLAYHTLRSKGSQTGFPDRVLVRDRVIFAELKREKTKPTPSQVEWLDGLAKANAEVYVWRPSDLDEIGEILSMRARPIAQPNCAWRV
jgi:hypothetical protein